MVVAVGIQAPLGRVLGVINFPSNGVASPEARVLASAKASVPIRMPQARVLAAVLGRVAHPKLRAWTYTLDGHDYYVLRLGDQTSLIYDATMETWQEWTSGDLNFWRANVGANWLGGTALAFRDGFNSNVVVGDDTFGLLWMLNPRQGYDDDAVNGSSDPQSFERIYMAQVAIRGRTSLPCYVTFLTANLGAPSFTGAGVTLYTSDDAGATFDNKGTITVTPDDMSQIFSWRSLGQINAPGRLFKLVDNGAFTRVDSFDVNDDGK